MKKLLFILMFGIFAIFSSCEEDEIVESQIDFLFKETYCANPWESDVSPEWTREQLISSYLTDLLAVEFSDLLITGDGVAQNCSACFCLSGDIIRITAVDEFSEVLLGAGFELD